MARTPRATAVPAIGQEHLHRREIIFEYRLVLAKATPRGAELRNSWRN